MPINIICNALEGTNTTVRGDPTSLIFTAMDVQNGN
jgi:hypothetical protein